MANRTFTQANNDRLYCNLKAVFRVGSELIMYAYKMISQQPTGSTPNAAKDPFAPVQLEMKDVKKRKVNSKQIMDFLHDELKQYGYSVLESAQTALADATFDGDDIRMLTSLFPDLEAEFNKQHEPIDMDEDLTAEAA